MTDDLQSLFPHAAPTAEKPLQGLTVLVVEDSRFASEALRLMCLRSGARIRRADCLRSARRHLQLYRPQVAVVDLGLPDGRGEGLIAELAQATPRIGAILATSGDDGAAEVAMTAGADAFLAKPLASLGEFQQTVLSRLPPGFAPVGPRPVRDDRIDPDFVAFRDDMIHAADLLADASDPQSLSYVAQFLGGVARTARDMTLAQAARRLLRRLRAGQGTEVPLNQLCSLVDARIAAARTV